MPIRRHTSLVAYAHLIRRRGCSARTYGTSYPMPYGETYVGMILPYGLPYVRRPSVTRHAVWSDVRSAVCRIRLTYGLSYGLPYVGTGELAMVGIGRMADEPNAQRGRVLEVCEADGVGDCEHQKNPR